MRAIAHAPLFLLAMSISDPALAVQRAFVASYGADVNTSIGCNLANPCRGFAAAMTVIDSGGEIIALDAAGYGPVTIDKSVTIAANPGFHAGIAAPFGIDAVKIATPGVKVTLRHLVINGVGAYFGIRMGAGASLTVENCVIANFGYAGIEVSTPAAVHIVDSIVRDNSFMGIGLLGGAKAQIDGTTIAGSVNHGIAVYGAEFPEVTRATISDSTLSANDIGLFLHTGLFATARATLSRSTVSDNNMGVAIGGSGAGSQTVTVSATMITGNAVGLLNSAIPGGVSELRSLGNNTVDQNGENVSGTVVTIAGN